MPMNLYTLVQAPGKLHNIGTYEYLQVMAIAMSVQQF